MANDKVLTDNTDLKADDIKSRALGRLNALKVFFLYTFKKIGVFLLGILIGMGIILKNPPKNPELTKQLEVLQEEKNTLEKYKSNTLVLKSSVELP